MDFSATNRLIIYFVSRRKNLLWQIILRVVFFLLLKIKIFANEHWPTTTAAAKKKKITWLKQMWNIQSSWTKIERKNTIFTLCLGLLLRWTSQAKTYKTYDLFALKRVYYFCFSFSFVLDLLRDGHILWNILFIVIFPFIFVLVTLFVHIF